HTGTVRLFRISIAGGHRGSPLDVGVCISAFQSRQRPADGRTISLCAKSAIHWLLLADFWIGLVPESPGIPHPHRPGDIEVLVGSVHPGWLVGNPLPKIR